MKGDHKLTVVAQDWRALQLAVEEAKVAVALLRQTTYPMRRISNESDPKLITIRHDLSQKWGGPVQA